MTTFETIDRPHEILGLHSREFDQVVIVDAARARLRAIREANGSETTVRRELELLIVRAREQMLDRVQGAVLVAAGLSAD